MSSSPKTSTSSAPGGRGAGSGNRIYKVVILGEGGVGKSALVIQFVSHRFTEYHDPTIEDAYQQQARIDGEPAQLDILDTAGQLEFTTMREQYMRRGEGFAIVYSITDRRSFEEAATYKTLIDRVRNRENIPIVLVGNKCDLEERRKVLAEEGVALARQLGSQFFETSAARRQCVDDVFHGLVRGIRNKEQTEFAAAAKAAKKQQRQKRLRTFLNRLNVFKRRSSTDST